MSSPWRTLTPLVVLGGLSLAGYGLGLRLVVGRGLWTHDAYALLFFGLFGVYLLAVRLVRRRPVEDRLVVGAILGFGLLFRLAVLPSPVFLSSDLYRYLWDGRVQQRGFSPYRHPPAAEALAPLRDEDVYPRINRPTQPTVYPPLAEAVFRAVAAVAPDRIGAWRLFVLACEAATVGLLLGLLRRTGVPGSAVIVYAWAPLAVFESVQAGHVDFVMLPLLLLALRWRLRDAPVRAGAALGAATLVKLYPAVLLVAWWRRGELRFPAAFAATLAAGYLVYGHGVGGGVLGFLPRYFGSAEDFNIGLRLFLTDAFGLMLDADAYRGLGGIAIELARRVGFADEAPERLLSAADVATLRGRLGMPDAPLRDVLMIQAGHEVVRAVAMLALLGALAGVLVWIARRRAPGPAGVLQAGMAAVAAYLLLVPTALHAWYAAWILPFLAARPSPAWLWFTGAVSLSYLKYGREATDLPLWARLVEFLPLYALLVWEWRRRRTSGR